MSEKSLNGISRAPWFVPTAEACGIFDTRLQILTDIVDGSDKRLVGKSSLMNVIVRHQSLKNGQARMVESHTCELLFAYELEMDPSVLAYACQPPCRRIERANKAGKPHISSAHLDFLVFYRDRIELVECKKLDWLERRGERAGWVVRGGRWEHEPYQRFADQLGLSFRVWTPPFPAGTYQQNLEICYAALMDRDRRVPPTVSDAVCKSLASHYLTMSTLVSQVSGLQPCHVLLLLATGRIFGSLSSASLNDPDNFYLGLDREVMQSRDELVLKRNFAAYTDELPSTELSRSSCVGREKAIRRLEWLQAIERGEKTWTRRAKELASERDRAIAAGRNPLEALLPAYYLSGNREGRLDSLVRKELENVIDECWLSGALTQQVDLFHELKDRCSQKGLPHPSKKTLWTALQKIPKERVALATGGKRAFHAVRPSSDPLQRSMPPLGFGQVIHVDSTDVDLRHAPDLLALVPEGKAKLYYGVDGGSGCAMADVLIFGPARTDGLALLHREYVRRHGREPGMYHFDRGAENKSHWVNELCDGHTHIRWSPAGGSQYNGQVEQCLKQINHFVSHRLIGNTQSDRAGRAVDGRFKSRNNAKTSFADIRRLIADYLYTDYQRTPGEDGFTPAERRDEAIDRWGYFGASRKVDDDFLFETSVPIKIGRKVVPGKGVRTEAGFYVSDALSALTSRGRRVDDMRADSEDPSFIYVRSGRDIVKAFRSDVQRYLHMSSQDRLFELLLAPLIRSASRSEKEAIGLERHRRTRQQNAETTAHWNGRSPTSAATFKAPVQRPMTTAAEWDAVDQYEVDDETN
ncbi:putative transposase [Luteibacter sp. HA06]